MGRAARNIRPCGHFKLTCLASYRKRLSGTRLLIGSALAGDQGINAAPLERAVDFGVGVARVRSDHLDVDARNRSNLIDLQLDHLPFVRSSGRDRDVQNDADLIINGRVLLVSGLEPAVSGIGGHYRIGISRSDLPIFAALPVLSLSLALVIAQYMLLGEAVPTHIGADQRLTDCGPLPPGDFAIQAGLDVRLNIIRNLSRAPALACASGLNSALAARAITSKPANGDLNLSLTHQLAIVHDPGEQTRSHQPYCGSGPMSGRPSFANSSR